MLGWVLHTAQSQAHTARRFFFVLFFYRMNFISVDLVFVKIIFDTCAHKIRKTKDKRIDEKKKRKTTKKKKSSTAATTAQAVLFMSFRYACRISQCAICHPLPWIGNGNRHTSPSRARVCVCYAFVICLFDQIVSLLLLLDRTICIQRNRIYDRIASRTWFRAHSRVQMTKNPKRAHEKNAINERVSLVAERWGVCVLSLRIIVMFYWRGVAEAFRRNRYRIHIVVSTRSRYARLSFH